MKVALFIIGFIVVGTILWGVWCEYVSPKIAAALEPDPKWDEKTRKRFDARNGWIFILVVILLMGVMRKCDGGAPTHDPDESPYDEPLFK